MRVLFTNEAPLIKYGLAEGFGQIGCRTRVIQGEKERLWGGLSVREQKKRLLAAVGEFKPDFIFTEGYPGFDVPTVCHTIRSLNIPHLYWAIEDPVSTDYTSMCFAPSVDYIFTTAAECVPGYEAMGKGSEVLLFGCNPNFHYYTGPREDHVCDLVLVASNYAFRYQEVNWFIMPLVEKGCSIKIWGHFWMDPGAEVNLVSYPWVYYGLLPYEDLPAAYSSARIVLGVNCDDTSSTQTSMRPYEALGCGGGLYLAHYTQAQENIFGDLIWQVRNTEQALAAVNTILAMSDNERRERARVAQKEVYEKHNYRLRAQQILQAFRRL
ncbi:MAG: glycosyltransferase [Syntrophomonadaceae bacterium]|nr:glycosyltransferase [Syntrophomonadaceae bacterium]